MIRIHYPGQTAGILSMQEAQIHANQVINGLRINSYGKINDVTIDITDDLQMPNVESYYKSGPSILKIRKDAFKRAEQSGFDISSYDRIVIFSKYIWRGARGLGTINFQVIFTSTNTPWVTLHELGHSFGWRHANFWQVMEGSPIASNGSKVEYGDKFDMMGGSAGPPPHTESNYHHFNPFYKERAGWVSSTNILTITQPGTYRIHTVEREPAPGEYIALRLRKNPKTEYWIYYRSNEVPDGPLISQMFTNNIMPSLLLDMTPGSKPGQGDQFLDWQDAQLAVGETFNDPQMGMTVKTIQVTEEWVEVMITGTPQPVDDLPVMDVVTPVRSVDVFGKIAYEMTAFSPKYGNFNGAGIAKTKFFLCNWEDAVIGRLRNGLDPPPEYTVATKELVSPPYRWTFDAVNDVSTPLDWDVYFLVVRAISVDGDTNTFWYEHIIDNSFAPPSTPALSTPPNHSTDLQTDITFAWAAAVNADSYRIQVATDSNFSSPIVDQGSLTGVLYTANNLSNDTQYYWRVNASNQNGAGDWSETWTFDTVIAPPDAPILLAPSDNATHVDRSPILRWSAAVRAETYTLQVAPVVDFSVILFEQSGITETSFQVTDLDNETKYFWRVRAFNQGGASNGSEVWSFTTVNSLALPAAPALSTPPNHGSDLQTDLTFIWFEVGNADSYRIQVATDSIFSAPTVDQSGLTDISYVANDLSNDTQYYWRVNAVNQNGTGNWSEIWTFRTIIAPPETPILVEPSDNATGVDTSLVLRWNEAPRAETYTLQVARNASFSDILIEQSGVTETSFQVFALEHETEYFWRVRAFNRGGASNDSQSWSFTTETVTSIGEPDDRLPTHFNLAQNYPNPFNPVTTIEFELPQKEFVTLTIVNALGTHIVTLLSAERNAGKHRIQWEAKDYPSGIYFARLVTSTATQTRKMILLK